MPVYAPKDYEKIIARIRIKTAAAKIEMGRCLSEEVITAFEESCHIQLPQAYRMFLKQVGNGCEEMLDGFKLNGLEDMERRDLSKPFRLEEEWIWEDEDGRYGERQNIIEKEIAEKAFQGNIELIDVGDGMTYNLIVTGKCRGEVWSFSGMGVQPCCERQDFLGWFELWLDHQEETDYFKDYVYG